MPELPEVETIRRDLADALLGRRLASIKILSPKSASHPAAFLNKKLSGRKLVNINRRGKLLIFDFSSDYLLIHLKMTGQLIYQDSKKNIFGGHSLSNKLNNEHNLSASVGGKLPNKHTRAMLVFESGANLFFNDLRKFGYLKLVDPLSLKKILEENYGLEPLTNNFTYENFRQILENKKTKIKVLLLDQRKIAGLGNIYVDEALFAAGIRPQKIVSALKEKEIKKLWQVITKIIKKAVVYRGTTFNNYVDSKGQKGNYSQFLKVYGRKGKKCQICQSDIIRIKIGGRGTHYCPNCQK